MINQNWWFTTLLVKQFQFCPPLNKSIKCEVLIVGGGMTGISGGLLRAQLPQAHESHDAALGDTAMTEPQEVAPPTTDTASSEAWV